MPERTETSVHIPAPAPWIVEVVADFAAYPQWAHGVKETEVLSTEGDGWADRVRFHLDAGVIRDQYVLDYDWQLGARGTGSVSWEMVQGRTLKALRGAYVLAADGSGTLVTYRLCVQPSIPMLGALRRKAEQTIIGTALSSLSRRVTELHPSNHEGEAS